MGQVNVNYDERLLEGIDRLCSARGLSRAELMRAIATEAVEAHDAGRLAFQIEDGPRIDGSLNALAAQVREAVVELERAQRSTQRHERRMMDAWVGNEDSIRQAQENLTARVNDINRKSYEPFVNKIRDVISLFEGLKTQVAKTQEAGLAKVLDSLEAVRAEVQIGEPIVWIARVVSRQVMLRTEAGFGVQGQLNLESKGEIAIAARHPTTLRVSSSSAFTARSPFSIAEMV